MEKSLEYYHELLEDRLVIGDEKINNWLVKGLNPKDVKDLVSNIATFNTGYFEGNFEDKSKQEYLYLMFSHNVSGEVHFILYKLLPQNGKIDSLEFKAFAAYCTKQLGKDEETFQNIYKTFQSKAITYYHTKGLKVIIDTNRPEDWV